MNTEIKEIIEYIKKWMGLSEIPMIVKLEDYIINLQQLEQEHKKINGELREEITQLTNNWNKLEECVESRLMSIPDDICTNEVEEARRTTKIAVYQVILQRQP